MTDRGDDPRLGGRMVQRVIVDAAAIAARVRELGAEITSAYPDGDLVVLGLLKGSFLFVADLVREIRRPLQLDFLVVSSYGNRTTSSGVVTLMYDPATSLSGRHVLVVDDIVDTGRTLGRLLDLLAARSPRSVEVCALLRKRDTAAERVPARFVGFEAPNEFLVGYGLDHAE